MIEVWNFSLTISQEVHGNKADDIAVVFSSQNLIYA